ncbi:DUF5995 family protein [Brevibacillus migulae]|uniref:DUF5995 family protein n=1 Tax=Brevibacillus migulae TaxID=1644114 RepID=UPI00106ED13E|nr:DUF5995 family protein [Brevibacillus migulae]
MSAANKPGFALGNAASIDEVIDQMNLLIEWSIRNQSRLGYFAALYRLVTIQVKQGIRTGFFENGPRMERLDVIFANRYLDALQAYMHGQPVSESWRLAFTQADNPRLLVLQHLLLGMNAHINLDLGIASAQTCPGKAIADLRHDFLAINRILSSLVDEVRTDIDRISPWIGLLDHVSPAASKAIINFSMEKARGAAWEFALSLAPLPEEQKTVYCHEKDKQVTGIGTLVYQPPGFLFQTGLFFIRLRESTDIGKNIRLLQERNLPPVSDTGQPFSM